MVADELEKALQAHQPPFAGRRPRETGGAYAAGAFRSGAVWVNPAADRQAAIGAITVE